MKQLSLGAKLIIFFLLVGLIPFGVIGVVSYVKSSNALSEAAYGQIKGMRALKKVQITQFFDERQDDLGVLLETVANLQEDSFHKAQAVHTLQKEQIEAFFQTITKDVSLFSRHRKFQDSFAAYDQGFNSVGQERSPSYKKVEAKYQKFLKTTMEEVGPKSTAYFFAHSSRGNSGGFFCRRALIPSMK